MIGDEDVEDLIGQVRAAQLAWANGTVHPLFDLSEGTIFGPFGGPVAGGAERSAVQAAIAARFHDGTSELEVIQTIVSGEIVCLVVVEHNTVRFDDDAEPRAWTLRVTMVFRREVAGWTLLHRHADPLVGLRDLATTLGLLGDGA